MLRACEHPEDWAAAEIESIDRLYPVACRVTHEEGIDGTNEAIRRASRGTLDGCASGGGYVFGTSHSIMPGSDPGRYHMMLKALAEWKDERAGGVSA